MTDQKTKPQKPPYTADNKLREFIHKKRAEQVLQGKAALIRDITADLAAYCGLTYYTIEAYCNKSIIPSLPVAIKIAEYFSVKVEDIFFLIDE